jgi:hypothetical protein
MGTMTSSQTLVLFDTRDAIAVALRLALGCPRPEDGRADWSLVLGAASRERLAALAWSRSRRFIRDHAGDPIAGAWRRAALAAHVRGERQLALLREAAAALQSTGVDVIVLKGLPLGQQLYGDPFVRCSADIDLYVPAAQRERAATVLETIGWKSSEGLPPWHESWEIIRGDVTYYLELHSLLVSDHLAHVRPPEPLVALRNIGGIEMPVHAGDFVAPYLAVHLATHQLPPLLWVVDFATLWAGYSDAERHRACEAALANGLAAYLDWARSQVDLVQRVASGDWEALGALGVRVGERRDSHSIWRHLALAATNADRARLLGAFLVPRRVRGNLKAFALLTVARLRRRWRSLTGASQVYERLAASSEPARETAVGLRVEREDMVALTRDVVGAGQALRVRAPGGSMLPTVPRGALVRIGPLPSRGLLTGDVVLALTADGEPVLHRAISVTSDCVIMRGDAALHVDPPVPMSRVIGVATHVYDGGVERPIGRRPRRSISVSILKARRRLARMVRRAP